MTKSDSKPWSIIARDVFWAGSLSIYDTILLGDKAWWWRIHYNLWRAYRGWSPRQVLEGLPDHERLDTLLYGEAPASTVRKALKLCHQHFPNAASIADLGAGRGVLAMTAANHGWDVLAVEYLADFVKRSEPITRKCGWSVEWVRSDFFDLPVPATDIIHTSATAYPDEARRRLANKLCEECRPGQGVLTQDWNLEGERFEVLGSVPMPVSWGTAVFTLHLVL